MKRLTLYLFRHLAVATVFVTAGLTLVIWLTQSLRLLEIVVDGGAPVYLFLQLMLVTLPTFLSIVLPISLLAAVLFTYNRLTMDSELVVMRSAGLGPWGLAKPALILALLVTMIGYGLTLYLAPAAHRELSRLESLARSEFSTVFLREGVFNEAGDGVTVYVRRRMPDGELQGLLIHDTRVPGKPVTINADRGMTVEGEAGTRVVVFDGNRQEVDLATGRMSQLYFDRYAVDLRIFEKQFAERVPDARERSTAELMRAADDPELLPIKSRLTAELHQRYTSPIFALGFTMMGVAILLVGEFNRRGQGRRIVSAVAGVLVLQSAALGITNLAVNNNAFIPLLYVLVTVPLAVGAFLMIRPRLRGGRASRFQQTAG
ncbi:LPS export ABC transporter permease LptF [Skermanella mucosa]|uniref:LPS export ABC transporter permease LptF n=1 Tax=Skermanella mucosa TaxID=1789672 RepID=UPI00192CCF44|nr:LPS export ABC transporter permease LptF [Skermanella mucosa]UEM22606.1 LPS export ABC transporter permease LptF [Skermanella mucosa]